MNRAPYLACRRSLQIGILIALGACAFQARAADAPAPAPTTAPSAAPTTAPDAAPTTAPSAAPTTAPDAAPTTAPAAPPPAIDNALPVPAGLALQAPAEPARKPIVKEWWFWTGIGVVVAGGIVAAILLTRSSPRPACPMDAGFVCQ